MAILSHSNNKINVEQTRKTFTSFSGLIPFINSLHTSGLINDLSRRIPDTRKRKRGYSITEKIISMVTLMFAGGVHLDDMARLSSDRGLLKILGIRNMPSESTLSTFLNSITENESKAFNAFFMDHGVSWYHKHGITDVTLDIDSSICENDKSTAEWTYVKGVKGYNPMLIMDEENSLVLAGLFRNGNASPQSDILPLLEKVLEKIGTDIHVTVRIDSAGYQKKIVRFCKENGIDFCIAGDRSEAKIALFKSIPDHQWHYDEKSKYDVARTKDWIQSKGKSTPVTIIVKRKRRNQCDLMEGAYWYYYVITSLTGMDDFEIWRYYSKRGNAENVIKDLKQDFWLDTSPCTKMSANAFMMTIGLFAYNVFTFSKEILLQEEWRKYTLKTIRYRLFVLAGQVIVHARRIILKINELYAYLEELLAACISSQFAPVYL